MTTSPISSSSSPLDPDTSSVKIGNTQVKCYNCHHKDLTIKAVKEQSEVATLIQCASNLSTLQMTGLDASASTIFTLSKTINEELQGKRLTTFQSAADMCNQVDPSGEWLKRVLPDGEGDTLASFASVLQEVMIKMGVHPNPTIKTETVSYKSENLQLQHTVTDQFRTLLVTHLIHPPHGQTNFVIVNCDQALTINGALGMNGGVGSKISPGEYGGNFCIVGGFNKEHDRVLLLDLDLAYPAEGSSPAKESGIYWVPLADLADAMNTWDDIAKSNRGYLSFSLTTA